MTGPDEVAGADAVIGPDAVIDAEQASPRISVALGTHNGAVFIREQLVSILEQRTPVTEIVLSDDVSTDDTIAIATAVVEEYRAQHPERTPDLRIIRGDGVLGVTKNFERALQACTGELIALADQDDRWHPDRISRAVNEFRERPELMLVHADATLVDAHGAPIGQDLFGALYVSAAELADIRAGRALTVLLRRNVVTGATVMIRAELVRRAAPFPASWVHDEWLAMVAAVTGGVTVLSLPLIDYRQHGNNQIGATTLGLAGKIGRLRTPRTARNTRLLRRADDLAQRIAQLTDDTRVREAVQHKLEHERARSALPRSRFRRLGPVLREWRTGRYRSYGLGRQDLLRDLIQPV